MELSVLTMHSRGGLLRYRRPPAGVGGSIQAVSRCVSKTAPGPDHRRLAGSPEGRPFSLSSFLCTLGRERRPLGSLVHHRHMVNISTFDLPPPGNGLTTVTPAIPGVATSLAKTVARSWVLPRNSVGRSRLGIGFLVVRERERDTLS